MSAWEWVRLIAGGALLLCGLVIFVVEVYGVFHLKYVLNRMHAAALGDTLGIACSMLGLMVLSGLHFSTVKMALVVIFLWFASPVSSHLLARMEGATNERLGEHCQVYEELGTLEAELAAERPEAAKESGEGIAKSGEGEES